MPVIVEDTPQIFMEKVFGRITIVVTEMDLAEPRVISRTISFHESHVESVINGLTELRYSDE